MVVEAVEDVELGQGDGVDAGDLDRVAGGHGVEPAAAPRPAGGGAELGAALAHAARRSASSSSVGKGPLPTRVA